jgi:capsular polysaccharide export protein
VLNTPGPGYFATHDASGGRVTVFDRDINPWQLLERCHAVYTVSSQLGFEALMAGKPVTCFGLPFYAGWGLTRDRVACPRRRRRRSLAQVFAAAYLLYPTYVDPYLDQRCDFERAAEILLFLRARNETNRVPTSLVGLTRRELRAASRLYRQAGGRLTVAKRVDRTGARSQGDPRRVLLGMRSAAGLSEKGDRSRQSAAQILTRPFAERLLAPRISRHRLGFRRMPVDEAHLGDAAWRARLATMTCGMEDRRRARQLIVALRDLKLHLGEDWHGETPRTPEAPPALVVIEAEEWQQRETVLGVLEHLLECGTSQDGAHRHVVVASSHGASLKALLRENACRPESGLTHVPLDAAPALVTRAAELHVVSAPLGVLGLVHGKNVVVHGRPIYAGWGLTEDRHQVPAGERRLSLEELIAGLFLHAHDYLDPHSDYPGELAWILAPALGDRAPRLRFRLDSRTALKIDYTLGKLYSLIRLWPAGRE